MPAARTPACARSRLACRANGRRIEIIRAGGEHLFRHPPPGAASNVSVVVEQDGRQESGSFGGGGRSGYETYLDPDYWQDAVDEALRQALVNLDIGARAGRRDDGGAGAGLARHPAARSDRPRPGRRFQPQEDIGLRRAAGRARRRARRDRGG